MTTGIGGIGIDFLRIPFHSLISAQESKLIGIWPFAQYPFICPPWRNIMLMNEHYYYSINMLKGDIVVTLITLANH